MAVVVEQATRMTKLLENRRWRRAIDGDLLREHLDVGGGGAMTKEFKSKSLELTLDRVGATKMRFMLFSRSTDNQNVSQVWTRKIYYPGEQHVYRFEWHWETESHVQNAALDPSR